MKVLDRLLLEPWTAASSDWMSDHSLVLWKELLLLVKMLDRLLEWCLVLAIQLHHSFDTFYSHSSFVSHCIYYSRDMYLYR